MQTKFFTFPVAILQGALIGKIKACMNNAMNYACYVKYAEVEDMNEVESYFGIKFNNKGESIIDGKNVFDKYGQNVPMVSVNRNIVFDYYKNPKTEFEIATFLAFCGLRSILGTKAYTKTNNEHLMARMGGYGTYKEFEEAKVKIPYFDNFATKQKIRYQLTDKIIRQELGLNWGLKYYSNRNRGFYFSFVIQFDALVMAAEQNSKSYRLKEKKASESETIRAVKKRLEKCG